MQQFSFVEPVIIDHGFKSDSMLKTFCNGTKFLHCYFVGGIYWYGCVCTILGSGWGQIRQEKCKIYFFLIRT